MFSPLFVSLMRKLVQERQKNKEYATDDAGGHVDHVGWCQVVALNKPAMSMRGVRHKRRRHCHPAHCGEEDDSRKRCKSSSSPPPLPPALSSSSSQFSFQLPAHTHARWRPTDPRKHVAAQSKSASQLSASRLSSGLQPICMRDWTADADKSVQHSLDIYTQYLMSDETDWNLFYAMACATPTPL